MNISEKEIEHLANLSNFTLDKKEKEVLTKDLENILKYVSKLDELDTENVEPTYQVFEMENVWRADEIIPQDADREELLALTKESIDNQIKVPKVL
ncbi:Asp-tRNA(Asn)/Glu-tRNA(Gln) amidotransferase subunit GatC [Candidatus Saccharibacteria bacterium]|nr:Asp-tRNA(Asn)/Glu-tRNA(Gln) amidotransferase subunit GatC [Candidatus Saccharibacteria bacterium]